MDINCPRCGEPWDLDSLHDAVAEGHAQDWEEARAILRDKGCGVLFGGRPCQRVDSGRAAASAALMDMMGDDLDGVASMLDDFDFIGMLD